MFKLCVFFLVAIAAHAASVSGRVYDPAGGVVPGVQVTLTNVQSGASASGTTTASGEYSFPSLVAGRYELQVAAPGFQYGRARVTLEANTARNENFVLRLGEVQETLEVRGSGTPRPQSGPTRIRVGGNIQATKLLRQPRPVYPEKARAEGREGIVVLRAVIGKDGTVNDVVSMADAYPDLAVAAVEALKQWQYQPTLLNGQPVEVVTTVQINFRLAE